MLARALLYVHTGDGLKPSCAHVMCTGCDMNFFYIYVKSSASWIDCAIDNPQCQPIAKLWANKKVDNGYDDSCFKFNKPDRHRLLISSIVCAEVRSASFAATCCVVMLVWLSRVLGRTDGALVYPSLSLCLVDTATTVEQTVVHLHRLAAASTVSSSQRWALLGSATASRRRSPAWCLEQTTALARIP